MRIFFASCRAYSRPILNLTIKHCYLLRKLYKALIWCKTLRKGNRGQGEIFGALFSNIKPFFHKKCPSWPILNAALNFKNMLCHDIRASEGGNGLLFQYPDCNCTYHIHSLSCFAWISDNLNDWVQASILWVILIPLYYGY